MSLTPDQEARFNKLFKGPPLKTFMVIEIPAETALVTIGQLSETVTKFLHANGVDPVRSTFVSAEKIEDIRGI